MKNLKVLILLLFLFPITHVISQENSLSYDTYLIAMRDFTISKNSPTILNYAFHEGDEISIKLSTKKDKTIDKIKITQHSKVLFEATDYNPTKEININITETGLLDFTFSIRSFSQDIDFKLMRKAEYVDGRYFNTAIELTKTYDTVQMAYETNQVVGYEEHRDPILFKTISDVDYESVQMSAQKYSLKGDGKDFVTITRPQDTIKSEKKEMVLVGYQLLVTSQAGAESMWKAINIGVDVGCLALSLFVPGGAAVGLGVETMFSMVAPQEGGEPIYYVIMGSKEELDKFMDNDNNTNPMVYEYGLATGYSANWIPMQTMYIGLKNLNVFAQVDVSVATYAIYQATTWTDINQDIVTILPKVEKVPMEREVIRNQKKYVFQK